MTDDLFAIDEVTIYEGDWVDKDYAVAGDILDGVSVHLKWFSMFIWYIL